MYKIKSPEEFIWPPGRVFLALEIVFDFFQCWHCNPLANPNEIHVSWITSPDLLIVLVHKNLGELVTKMLD